VSTEAYSWAKSPETICPCPGSKDVLKSLGLWAGELGFSWVKISTIAGEVQRGERQVKRLLMKLVQAGIVIRYDAFDRMTDRQRTCAYFMPWKLPEPTPGMLRELEDFLSARVTRMSPSPLDGEGDTYVTPRGDTEVTGEGVTGVTPGVTMMSPLVEEPYNSEADASSTGGRVGANAVRELVEAIWRVWPSFGRKTSSPKLLTEALTPLLDDGVAAKRLLMAAVDYAADKSAWGTSGKPKACGAFYAEGRWENFGEPADPARLGEEPADLFGFDGPMSVWNAVVSAESEAFAKSYLAKSVWREADATILAWSTMAAAQLTKIFDKLERAGVREVIWKGAA
jgi:hypothetical protein